MGLNRLFAFVRGISIIAVIVGGVAATAFIISAAAKKAGVAANTVSRFENDFGAMVETLARIQAALERAGVIFIPADQAGGPGVRLREVPNRKAKRKRSR